MRVRFHEVPHFMPHTNAVEFASTNGGGRFVYGADHRPTEELVQFARDADLLFIEATLPRPERDGVRGPHHAGRGGRARPQANARQAVLIHISDEMDRLWAEGCASQAFGPADQGRRRRRRLRSLNV
jgi:ribonuclease BN (tRNA processing enzyme)